ncbi:hypothetical protein [Weissella cibaria]|uniref:hypothetical protein n=1 Tax=Weissella cibaria TaxID=137591 RepID=UPI0013E8C4B6|nr:hypothetical protein [Weissella cibaria]
MAKSEKFNWVKWVSAIVIFPLMVFGPIGGWMLKLTGMRNQRLDWQRGRLRLRR